MENTVSQSPPTPAAIHARGPWILGGAGLILFPLSWIWQGNEAGYWLPGLGIGIALVSWLGWRILAPLAIELLLVRWWTHYETGATLILGDAALHIAVIAAAWWLYHSVARGSRWLDDPTSVTIFLILIPGGLSALAAIAQAVLWVLLMPGQNLMMLAARFWLSRMAGILVVVPFLLVACTPMLLRYRLLHFELPPSFFGEKQEAASRRGEWIELAGLTFATCILALLLLWTRVHNPDAIWMLWGCCLVLIVWTCIRQGLHGGCFCASLTSMVVLAAAQVLKVPPEFEPAVRAQLQPAVQGNLLAFCSSALLIGVSASWIRANETRYRHVVSRIPFVVYSARLPYGIPSLVNPATNPPREGATRDSKLDHTVGPSISKLANVMLVSPASKQVFGCEPETLLGPFSRWVDQIEAEDRILVIASLAQLCLQKQPVTCEYRLQAPKFDAAASNGVQAAPQRWVRDTLTPHYSEDGLIDGWEGLVEDITDQRALSHNLRRISNMLQVLITNLPTGVYFVQAPLGYPILVNARARQLLGQREDLSTGVANLSRVFRLHRQDGSEYPADELPVAKALRGGTSCRANDIVVHRADGRKIPLITWAAPIDLNNKGVYDAAVWVLEDWSAMQQTELALRESELRLRAVIETMEEGVIVQDLDGMIIDCNPAACTILGIPRERLMFRNGLIPETICLQENGTVFPRAEQPDQAALRNQAPARDIILGLPLAPAGSVRWILANSVPLPVGPGVGLNHQRARVVTTFADITQQRQAQASLRAAKDKYQSLVETLPFMLIQRDRHFDITYLNPAVAQATGYSVAELMAPGFCRSLLHPDDQPIYDAVAQTIAEGKSSRIELRFQTKEQTYNTLMAFFHPNFHDDEVVGSTCLLIDISKQRRLEEELVHARHLELVGRLASGTVHDLNNLLTVIMGLAGLSKAELAEDHPVWQNLTRIEDVGEQAAHMTGQLLTFSKQRPKESRPIDLNAAVTQTVKLAQSVIPRTIEVESFLDPEQPMVLGDENQLKQVLMNLCFNARDAMKDGGRLSIHTDVSAPPAETDGKKWVHLAIADTGHGMDEPTRARIFEPFFSTKERGTGLGLAVVQQIVKEFGGHIDVWSAPEKGTRFDIWLPRA